MAEPQNPEEQISFLLANFNTRLRELEDRNRMLKERLSLLSKNLISLKEENQKEFGEMKEIMNPIKQEMEKLKDLTQGMLAETNNFVRRTEIIPVERMLRDFSPLEFARKKELEELRKELLPLAIEKTIKPGQQPEIKKIETTETFTADDRRKKEADNLSRILKTK